MPPAAATRPKRPTKVPRPTASSPKAISRPTSTGSCADSLMSGPIGLVVIEACSWAWMDPGLAASKKKRFVSFWSPTYVKVTPRNALRMTCGPPGVSRSRANRCATGRPTRRTAGSSCHWLKVGDGSPERTIAPPDSVELDEAPSAPTVCTVLRRRISGSASDNKKARATTGVAMRKTVSIVCT